MAKPPQDMPALKLHGIKKRFQQGHKILNILRGANLSVGQGEIVALIGPSGTGKSTLLQIAGLLEKPDSGDVTIYGNHCKHINDAHRSKLRCNHIGFVYQHHNLLPDFTAFDNVLIPQMIQGKITNENRTRAEWLLEKVGLKDRMNHLPSEMSGGEQQRVAIVRALANKPHVLLADEPTGNLDPHTSQRVFNELMNLVRDTGLSALIATHNPELANQMDRRVSLSGGVLVQLDDNEEIY
ncbi:MAG: ABC transporter ATP-binding protein [Alphaproteobacteria bacterium]|nr:ABC transporter ATP-binding protein [Alphaproteobacteria bacterium]